MKTSFILRGSTVFEVAVFLELTGHTCSLNCQCCHTSASSHSPLLLCPKHFRPHIKDPTIKGQNWRLDAQRQNIIYLTTLPSCYSPKHTLQTLMMSLILQTPHDTIKHFTGAHLKTVFRKLRSCSGFIMCDHAVCVFKTSRDFYFLCNVTPVYFDQSLFGIIHTTGHSLLITIAMLQCPRNH